jgi:hypothetical protein
LNPPLPTALLTGVEDSSSDGGKRWDERLRGKRLKPPLPTALLTGVEDSSSGCR